MTPSQTFPILSRGRAELAALVDRGTWSQHSLARAIIASQPTVRAWLRGTSRPGPHFRTCLFLVTGIDEDAWNTDEERKHVDRVRAAVAGAKRRRSGVTRAVGAATGTEG